MNDLLNMVYSSGDLLLTFCKLFILVFSFDCLIGIAHAIKSIKGVVS